MPAVARKGDPSNHGGVIITGATKTFVNGIEVARVGDLHSCPIPFHGVTPIVTGSPTVVAEGKAVARVGDVAGCGAAISSGSPDTEADSG